MQFNGLVVSGRFWFKVSSHGYYEIHAMGADLATLPDDISKIERDYTGEIGVHYNAQSDELYEFENWSDEAQEALVDIIERYIRAKSHHFNGLRCRAIAAWEARQRVEVAPGVKFGELCRLITIWEAHSDPIVLAGGSVEDIKPGTREQIVRIFKLTNNHLEYQVEETGKDGKEKHNKTALFKTDKFYREIKPLKEVTNEI